MKESDNEKDTDKQTISTQDIKNKFNAEVVALINEGYAASEAHMIVKGRSKKWKY
jgi:hypothetical protein